MATLFTDNWTFSREGADARIPVRLPHDAMIGEIRSPEGGTGNHGGYFPGGRYVYTKQWAVPDDATDVNYSLRFEGIFGATRVLVDGEEVARNDSPYREFVVPLAGKVRAGEPALFEVQVDNSQAPRSRWYTGSGIYRPVWLDAHGPVAIARDGVRVVTKDITASDGRHEATAEVTVSLDGAVPDGATVVVDFRSDGELVARRKAAVAAGTASVVIPVTAAKLWSAERPYLYDVSVSVCIDGDILDERQLRTGLRTVTVDAQHGMRVNGHPVLLRGTAVHHDNGPLGAATFDAAEWRRARLLKNAGYNAIRSAHNPLSRAFLDACDELGMYVMDELTDVWFRPKTAHDEASRFRAEWRHDATAMITNDRNRPSVIMYSIGNEIAESATPSGVAMAREIAEFLSTTDPTRPTTIAVNPLLAMMAAKAEGKGADGDAPPERKPATSTAANQMAAKMGRLMVFASTLPAAEKATRDVFSTVDIAGYNYGYASYRGARRRHPDRVIVGTESMPGDLPAIWKRVTSIPGVIGDFGWTGWDYLGEVGLGYWSYGDEVGGIAKPYPGILAGCGVFDITGAPGAALMLAQAVWGITPNPGIAVRPLNHAGQRPNKTPWLASDALPTWSWRDLNGRAEIEVYSAHDEVELLLNGRSLGRKAAGHRREFVTKFHAQWEPGELVAISFQNGVEAGRSSLVSAGHPHLRLRSEVGQLCGPDDLAYVWVELADESGIVAAGTQDEVTVNVSGAGSLAAFGSASPTMTRTYRDATQNTYHGRALAIVRGADIDGTITVSASSRRHGQATLTIPTSTLAAGDLAPVDLRRNLR